MVRRAHLKNRRSVHAHVIISLVREHLQMGAICTAMDHLGSTPSVGVFYAVQPRVSALGSIGTTSSLGNSISTSSPAKETGLISSLLLSGCRTPNSSSEENRFVTSALLVVAVSAIESLVIALAIATPPNARAPTRPRDTKVCRSLMFRSYVWRPSKRP